MITIQLICVYPVLEFRRHYDGSLRLGSFIRSTTLPNAVFISVDQRPFIEYYAHRKTICYPIGHWDRLGVFLHEVDSLLDKNVPVYVIPTAPIYLSGGIVPKSDFFELGPNGGSILSRLIDKGVLKEISPKEVSFELNNELKIKTIRDVAKEDSDRLEAIFSKTSDRMKGEIQERYSVQTAGRVLFEDYHHAELKLDLFMVPIYKLGSKAHPSNHQ